MNQEYNEAHNKLLTSYYYYWTNLITINGIIMGILAIMLSVYEAIPFIIKFILFPISLFFTLLSIIALIQLFRFFKNMNYEYLDFLNKGQQIAFDRLIAIFDKFKKHTKLIALIEFFAQFTLFFNFSIIVLTFIFAN
jgi:hypothetical protein